MGADCETLICESYEKVGLMDYFDPRQHPITQAAAEAEYMDY
ncbi:hypothetical protein ACVCFZ_05045 [Acinetobacter variabilis]